MMLSLYQAAAAAAGGIAYPFLRLAAAAGSGVLRERAALLPRAADGPPPLWCHAASVGEIESLVPIVEEVRRRHPQLPVRVSTVTVTGRAAAERRLPWTAPFLFPLDVPWIVERALARVAPRAVLLAETELWPCFVARAGRRAIPLSLVNGRISPRSFPRYRLITDLTRPLLASFALLAMQAEPDRERIVRLGAPPARARVVGNVKADAAPRPFAPEERARRRQAWGIPAEAPLLVAGSVRPEEVAAVLDGFGAARRAAPELRLLVAPRHLNRGPEVERAVVSRGWRCRRRSERAPAGAPASWDVLLLDTMGELVEAYGLGDVAFVGGTLHPRYGGHNPLEAAARAVPVVLGPHRRNCAETAAALLAAGGAREARDAEGVARAAGDWLRDAAARRAAGESARRAADALRGVAARTVDELEKVGFPW